MNKPTNKKQNYNDDILKILEDKYGYSVDYIRKCLRKDRTGIMPDEIIKDYRILDKAAKTAIKKASKV